MPLFAFVLVAGLVAVPAAVQVTPDLSLPHTNPRGFVTQRIGVTDVEVAYNRPSMKGRSIFGALVPYGRVWRTGADEATTVRFSTAVTLNGTLVASGTYALFTIPERGAWTVIVHRMPAQWGSYAYDEAHDVARLAAAPVTLDDAVETFTATFDEVTARSATLNLSWERTRVPVRIAVDLVGLVVPRIEAAMLAPGKKPYFLAAMFYFENGLDLDQAARWMAAALAETPDHIGMLHRQALILASKGDHAGARAAAQRSLDAATRAGPELRDEYIRLNTALLETLR